MNLRYSLAALALFATPALGWADLSSDTRCGFVQSYEGAGSTTFYFAQSKAMFDTRVFAVGVSNDNWSIKDGQKMTGSLKFTDIEGAWFSAPPTAQDHTLFIGIDEKFAMPFINDGATTVSVTQNGKLLDRLSFDGFGGAYRMFDQCREKKGWLAERKATDDAAAEAARLKRLETSIPRDPFAISPPPKPKRKKKR